MVSELLSDFVEPNGKQFKANHFAVILIESPIEFSIESIRMINSGDNRHRIFDTG